MEPRHSNDLNKVDIPLKRVRYATTGTSMLALKDALTKGSQSFAVRRRKELAITETELKLIAAAAIIGLRSTPVKG